MTAFHYQQGQLYCDQVPVAAMAAQVGTPLYVYSLQEMADRYQAYADAFPHALIAYAYKANANLALCRFLAQRGAGADVVSGGEWFVARQAGVPPERVVFNGNGKTRGEIRAAIGAGIRAINVDSAAELAQVIDEATHLGRRASIALRVNPDIDAHTHPHHAVGLRKSQFGIPIEDALPLYQQASNSPALQVTGIHCHIGSQITTVGALRDAAGRIAELVIELQRAGIALQHVNLGGGVGIRYRNETPFTPQDLAAAILPIIQPLGVDLILEPGRSIVAPAGALVAAVVSVKAGQPRRIVLDAGMNALLRPALYDAWHAIQPVQQAEPAGLFDVVGPICESTDVLGKARLLPALAAGDLVAIMNAGAYGYVLASNYNGRPRPAEVAVLGDRWWLIRKPESYADLIANVLTPDELF